MSSEEKTIKCIVKYKNGVEYNGKAIVKGGKGTMHLDNGDWYEGDFNNDKPNGEGTYHFNDGSKYVGEIKDGLFEGKGIMFCNNGDKYEGDFKKMRPDGKGIYYYKNGHKYEGDFKDGLAEGNGKLYYKSGDWYEGDFKNDKPNGKGIYQYKFGRRYEGDIVNTLAEGKGIMYYENGDRYDGDFKNDKPNGRGTYYCKDDIKYKGDFKEGLIEGKGIMYYENGDWYDGDFKNNKPNGYGIYQYKCGRRYEGDIVNTLAEGNGKMFYEIVHIYERYEGEFKNDKFNGKGILYFKNQLKFEGEFKDGEPILNIENISVDDARHHANNILNKLFGLKVKITAEIFEKTFFLPTCKLKVNYSFSKSLEAPTFDGENKIKVQDGRIKEFNPNIIFSKGKIRIELIENINKTFNTIANEIKDGTIEFSVNGDTFIIDINFKEHNLILEITPYKAPPLNEITEAESYCSNNKWKKLINLGLLLTKSFPDFSAFPMIPNPI